MTTPADTLGAQADIQDLRAQASSFEDQNDSIANAFWRGFEDGYDD